MSKLLPLLFLLAFAGCKKDDNNTDLLTRSWQVTAFTIKTASGDRIEKVVRSCDENRIYTFRRDGSFLSEPSPGCITNGTSENYVGTWTFIDKKILKVVASGGVYFDTEILMLTRSKLILHTGITLDGREGVLGGSGGEIFTEFFAR